MTFRRLILLVVPLLAALVVPAAAGTIVSSAPAPAGAVGTTSVITLEQGTVTRTYRLFVPTTLPSGARPLVLALHGLTSSAAAFEGGAGLNKVAGKNGLLVAYPEGLGLSWNAGHCCGTSSANKVDDVAFLDAVIADIAARFPVDRQRIGITGYSNGGMMAYRYICERSSTIDAAAVMSGTYVAPTCAFNRPVSLLHMHGLTDKTVPFAGGLVPSVSTKAFRSVTSTVTATSVMDGCAGLAPAVATSLLVSQTDAIGCPSGTRISLVTSSSMGHVWPTGASQVANFGFDAPTLIWGHFAITWGTRGAPVQL